VQTCALPIYQFARKVIKGVTIKPKKPIHAINTSLLPFFSASIFALTDVKPSSLSFVRYSRSSTLLPKFSNPFLIASKIPSERSCDFNIFSCVAFCLSDRLTNSWKLFVCLLSTSLILSCNFPLALSSSCFNTYLLSSSIQFNTCHKTNKTKQTSHH